MNRRFTQALQTLGRDRNSACIPYLTAGTHTDADLATLAQKAPAVVLALAFSDPCADSLKAAIAAQKALDNGATTADFFKTLAEIRTQAPHTAICVRAYANNIFAFGLDTFLEAIRAAGADAVTIPDLPSVMREMDPTWDDACKALDLELVELDAPEVQRLIQDANI